MYVKIRHCDVTMTSANREGVDWQVKKYRAEQNKDGDFHCKPHREGIKMAIHTTSVVTGERKLSNVEPKPQLKKK